MTTTTATQNVYPGYLVSKSTGKLGGLAARRKSLRFMLTAIVLAIIVLLTSAISIIALNAARKAVTSAFLNQLHNSITTINMQMVNYYQTQENNARFLATNPVIVEAAVSGNYGKATPLLVNFYKEQKVFENVFLSTPVADTEIMAAGNPDSVGLRWAGKGFDDNIKKTLAGNLHISDPFRSPVNGQVVVLITAPVMDKNTIVGILGLPFDVGTLSSKMVKNLKIGRTGYPMITSSKGLTFAHPNDDMILKLDLREEDFGQKILSSPSMTDVYYDWEGEQKIMTGLKNEDFGFITLSTMYVHDIERDVKAVIKTLVSLGTIGALLAAIIVIYFLRSRLLPLQDAVSASHRIAEGETDIEVTVKREDEIGELSMAIRTMIERLKERAQLADAIAAGDLTREVVVSSEKDTLGNALKNMVDKLTTMMQEMQENSTVLASSSEELSTVSADLASSSEEMQMQSTNVASATEQVSTNINTMASAAEEMSFNVQTISSTAEQMSQNMNAVAAAIEEMTVAIGDIANNAKEGASISQEAMAMSDTASTTMNLLGEAAKEIGEVTEVIKRIADKTNLLALNATIEAASAGDAGKGFAVVANEIKELANQSSQAAEDIANRIGGVQKNTEEAVKVIADVSAIIGNINSSVRVITESVEQQTVTSNDISANVQQASSGAANIASSISEVATGANDMSQNAGEAAKGANDVSANIQGVSAAAGQVNENSQQVNTSARDLARISGQLQAIIKTFKVS